VCADRRVVRATLPADPQTVRAALAAGDPGASLHMPSPARMYDYYLDGKNNFEVDREAAERALMYVPSGREVARENRRFLVRAVRHVARAGVAQFLDIGTGFPTPPNVQQVARRVNPHATVAYVDNDPVVAAHNRALLADPPGIAAVEGDIRDLGKVLADPEVQRVIDFSRPFCALFVASLHFVTDEEDPYAAVSLLREAMPAGSYLIVSHLSTEGTPAGVIGHVMDAYQGAAAPAVFRSQRAIGQFFDGFALEPPGIVPVGEWQRDKDEPPARVGNLGVLAGVGRHTGPA